MLFRSTPYPKTELFEVALRTKPERMAGINYAGSDYLLYPCVNLSEVSDKVLRSYLFKSNRALFLDPSRALRIVRDFPRPWSVWRYWRGVLLTLGSKKGVQLGQAPSETTLLRHKDNRGQEAAAGGSRNLITRGAAGVSVAEQPGV